MQRHLILSAKLRHFQEIFNIIIGKKIFKIEAELFIQIKDVN